MWRSFQLRGLFLAALGLCVLLWPDASIEFMVRVVGIFCIIDALTTMLRANQFMRPSRQWSQGAVVLVLGGVLLFWPDISSRIVVMLFGLWLLYTGMSQWLFSGNMSEQARSMLRVTGALSGIAGAILLFWPGAGLVTIAWLIGLPALFIGALLMAIGWRFRA